MEIKKASLENTESIMNIIKQAQNFFKRYEINQWEDDYPSDVHINEHIKNGEAYICVEDDDVAAFLIVSFNRNDKNPEEDYAVLHLLAVDNRFKSKGIATEMMFYLNRLCRQNEVYNVRTSVHNDNIAMRRTIKKSGFLAREHQVLNGEDFLEYEKTLKA